ncbi:MAG: ribonuclease HII [Candidatus Thermofonsia Clade 1 bacterium]|jgi:ribonuclease HII|uniref:Ribonuclease n=1 Tax=Candidatus Thermofonsia Clade 1 bacterium TaxID=2364210 RepID=A0A2M8PFN7_9CHLR|nr:MAG: ribonuclease HII [Candidatus Thermofonsia Clade 1 bacterium]RMF53545.1 MAG: ribonuclease HII [Chloroflexota bacterium]
MNAPLLVCGLDEAGRGALAGALVAAMVAFPPNFRLTEKFPSLPFRDSKKMTAKQRAEAIRYIYEWAALIEIDVVSVADINAHGIGWANRSAFEALIWRPFEAAQYIVDGNLKLRNLGRKAPRVRCIVRADEQFEAVAAASIVAKVKRDQIMAELHAQFPQYGWDRNCGYGTAEHLAALRQYGASPYHRTQFVATALRDDPRLPGF